MRTVRSLIASPYLVISHACPPRATMHTPRSNHAWPPRATTHAPPRSNHACPPRSNHACPPGSNHTPPLEQPHTPPQQPCTPLQSNHACPPSNHAHPPGATMHTPWEQPCMPPLWTEWQTGVKILACPKLRLRAVTIPNAADPVAKTSFYYWVVPHLKISFKTPKGYHYYLWPLFVFGCIPSQSWYILLFLKLQNYF